ncbi:MAG: Peroxiredoxin [Actinobacteria bacterium 66_15]|nr:MAG: Peroxiredoxin [Actinobacteria bacterium 66_15]
MRAKSVVLIVAVAVTAVLAIGGCSAGESGSGSADNGDVGEQNGLEVGTVAPDFRLKNQEQSTVALSDYKGVKNVILVFYPADFTPV